MVSITVNYLQQTADRLQREAIYEGVLDYYEWKGNNVSEYRL